jgi:hypothetical protein
LSIHVVCLQPVQSAKEAQSLKGIGPGLAKQIERFFPHPTAASLASPSRAVQQTLTTAPQHQQRPAALLLAPCAGGPQSSSGISRKGKTYSPRANSPAWALLLALRLARARSPAAAATKQALCAQLMLPFCQVRGGGNRADKTQTHRHLMWCGVLYVM